MGKTLKQKIAPTSKDRYTVSERLDYANKKIKDTRNSNKRQVETIRNQ